MQQRIIHEGFGCFLLLIGKEEQRVTQKKTNVITHTPGSALGLNESDNEKRDPDRLR